MTDNNVVQLLEHMGRCYRRSYVSVSQSRVEAIRALLVQELAPLEIARPTGPSGARARARFLTGFASLFHIPALRPVLAVLVLSIFSVGSLLKVASASLPGDALYTVKLVREQALVRLAPDNTARAKLAVQFAVTRADEVRQVVAREEPRERKAASIALAVAGLQEQVTTATDALATTADKKELTSLMKEGTQQIVTLLNDAKNEAIKNNGVIAHEVDTVFTAMSETQALVEQSANPPTTLALSVPIEVAFVAAPVSDSPPYKGGSDLPAGRQGGGLGEVQPIEMVRQPISLVNPAQSVFSLPIAQGIASEENLPMAVSIGSAP